MTLRTILSSASLPSVSKLRLMARRVVMACLVTLVYPLAAQAQADASVATPETVEASPDHRVFFHADVVPLLTRLGCNGGGCHGKASGQNGFRLSLLGFEPEVDYHALVTEARGRRIFPAAPERSLLLLKATAQMPHGGGRRLEEDSEDYRLLRDWIAQGATPPASDDPQVLSIEFVTPEFPADPPKTIPLALRAHYERRDARDVTRQAVYQSNEPEIATVDATGVVQLTGRPGVFVVSARYGEALRNWSAVVPYVTDPVEVANVERQLDALERQFDSTPVQRALLQQWRKLRVVPSGVAEDRDFLRRAMIDICGTLPTPDELRAFEVDADPEKHRKLVDRLLERPEYASYFAVKWADILQNRGAGYSTSQQRAASTLFAGWIRDSLAENKPYDEFVRELLTATGSQRENPPTVWYRSLRKPPEFVESVSQAFLGFRMQCAQCHHHPAEAWSQQDYESLAAIFSRIGRKGGFADAEVPTDEVIYVRANATLTRTDRLDIWPEVHDAADQSREPAEDPRRGFAEWMTRPDNPYFARTMANRLWAHFLGRGIIHPIDDARSSNPASNPELLQVLADEFTQSGYDIRHLVRVITGSHAYRLESASHAGNAADTQSFARFYPRRLTAETLLDGISQVLEVPTEFAGGGGTFPPGTRAIDLPDETVASSFLDVFGRPARRTACECERADAPSLSQALELVNSAEVHRKLTHAQGYARRLADSAMEPEALADEIFLRVLARPPREEERQAAVKFLGSQSDRAEGVRSLLWSLLATHEFLFNH
jgi:hypothetical protein